MRKALGYLAIFFHVIQAAICLGDDRPLYDYCSSVVDAAQNARPALPIDGFKAVPVVDAAELDRLKETAGQQAREIERLKADFVPRPPTPIEAKPLEPMRLSYPSGAAIHSEVMPAQLVISVWEKGCPACVRLKNDIKRTLAPLRWTIGETADCQIFFLVLPDQNQSVPQIALEQNGMEIRRWEGYQDPAMLSRELLAAWNSAGSHPQSQMATGTGGSIQASAQIDLVIDTVRKYQGDGVTSTTTWDANHEGPMSLFHMKEWDVAQMTGTSGRVQYDCPGAKGLPTERIGFTYRLIGRGVEVDGEPILFPGILDKYMPKKAVGAGPYGIIGIDDMLEIYWCIQMFRDIGSLLSPSCDLILPGQIIADVTLNGDVLTVDFKSGPTIKLVWLFTFPLKVKRVTITRQNIHVEFTGSRWIKSRDFKVEGPSGNGLPAAPIEPPKTAPPPAKFTDSEDPVA